MDIVTRLTDASWIGVPEGEFHRRATGKRLGNETAYFRKSFHLSRTGKLELSISAHSRYRLWVNGQPVCSGPCKGDRWRHYYETIDIGSYLQAGENVIAVKVVAYSPYEAQPPGSGGPFSIGSNAAGPCLIVSGTCKDDGGRTLADLATGKEGSGWKVWLDDAVSWESYPPTHFLGAMERVQGAKIPPSWREAGCPEEGWTVPDRKWRADGRAYGIIPPFPLQERPIPLLFERERSFLKEMPLGPGEYPSFSFSGSDLVSGTQSLDSVVIPPHSKRTIVFDAGELTTGYIRLPIGEGRNSRICLTYAESYAKPQTGQPHKGIRDDYEHFPLTGHSDVYWPTGEQEIYEPFWFRTFRFVKIEVETGEQALTLQPPRYRETGYPLEVSSVVESGADWINPLWETSIRTLQRCMHETYEDCPYYEQLQYTMDTRLQILFTYMTSGDSRLARRSIEDYHASLLPEGILQARFPSQESQVIPVFALHWILMVEDYYWQTGDASVPRRYRPTIDAVLDWYDRKMGASGLVENLGYWQYFDWVVEWKEGKGSPRATHFGPSTVHNMVYAHALKTAARLSRLTGRAETAEEYEERSRRLTESIHTLCWSEDEGLYKEGPEMDEYSQHAQVWAVISGIVSGDEASALMRRMLERQDLAKCSYAMSFYLFRALEAAGMYDATEALWAPWRELLKLQLTTWPEDPFMQRSDCHGWGALPLYEFTRCLLGINPESPGWEFVRIEPRPLSLEEMSGQVVTPKGIVKMHWKKENGTFFLTGESPAGVPTDVVLPDGRREHYSEGGKFSLSYKFQGFRPDQKEEVVQ